MKNWKTTACGALALLGSSIALYYPQHAAHGNFLAALGAGLGLLFARDANVSSASMGLDSTKAGPQGWQRTLGGPVEISENKE